MQNDAEGKSHVVHFDLDVKSWERSPPSVQEARPACCPVCGGERLVWRWDLAHEPSSGPVCGGCGIVVPRPVLTEEAVREARRERRLLLSA